MTASRVGELENQISIMFERKFNGTLWCGVKQEIFVDDYLISQIKMALTNYGKAKNQNEKLLKKNLIFSSLRIILRVNHFFLLCHGHTLAVLYICGNKSQKDVIKALFRAANRDCIFVSRFALSAMVNPAWKFFCDLLIILSTSAKEKAFQKTSEF